MNIELLYQLLVTPTVSGCEEAGQALALKYGKKFADKQFTDGAGNAVSTLNPEGEGGILLVGHMDEIGFRVTQIRDDGMNKILHGRLVPGATIGVHTHETDSEIIYFLSGSGHMLYDGKKEPVEAGVCHYCPAGHSHGMINDSDGDLIFFAVVPSGQKAPR